MIGSRGLGRGIGVVVVGLAVAVSVAASGASAQGAEAPSVRVLAADSKATVQSHGGRVFLGDAGLYVAASGGELRIDATRPNHRRWRAAQVDGASGAVLREVPRDLVAGGRGLARFLRVKVTDAAGDRVAAAARPFCPNVGSRERVDDTGPATPRFPRGCRAGFPFLRGQAWGIEAGWAVQPRLGAINLSPGRYTARIQITKAYRELFEIRPQDAKAIVSLRVKRGWRPREPVPVPGLDHGRAGSGDPESPLAAPMLADPDPATLPDLAALPLWRINAHSRGKRDLLSFAASPWNAGPAPLVVEGYRSARNVMDAYQYFFDPAGEVVGRAPAGTMEFHRSRGHQHWHFEQFARFSLRGADGSSAVRSHKQSFCIVPTDAVDLTVPGAEWLARSQGRSSCGGERSIWIRQQLPAGWADTYEQWVAGQAFNITKVPNGRYLVRMRVNPRGEVQEVTTDNNVADRVVRLGGKRGARTVVVEPWNGIRQ